MKKYGFMVPALCLFCFWNTNAEATSHRRDFPEMASIQALVCGADCATERKPDASSTDFAQIDTARPIAVKFVHPPENVVTSENVLPHWHLCQPDNPDDLRLCNEQEEIMGHVSDGA